MAMAMAMAIQENMIMDRKKNRLDRVIAATSAWDLGSRLKDGEGGNQIDPVFAMEKTTS